MTLLELSTDLSGRYVSFRVNPLSFKEIVEMNNVSNKNYKKYIITMDENNYNIQEINVINIFSLLMNDNF